MSVLAVANTNRLAEVQTDYDKMCIAFDNYNSDPTEANKLVMADNAVLSLMQRAAESPESYPSVAGATEIAILSIDPIHDSELDFTYRVDGGAVLEASLTDMYGFAFIF